MFQILELTWNQVDTALAKYRSQIDKNEKIKLYDILRDVYMKNRRLY